MSVTVKTRKSWFPALFGLVFFSIGAAFMLLSIVPTLYDASRMASWVETPGTLHQARLVTNYSEDNSATYRVDASYSYIVGGDHYTNDRVAINAGSDNIGDFHQRLAEQLEQAYRTEQTVSVWYDPANPADSVLNRDLRWDLLGFKSIFVILFGGIGLAMIYFGLRVNKTATISTIDTPAWLKSPEWQDGVIRSGAKSGMYFAWGFAGIWNLISIPITFVVIDNWREEGMLLLLILIFPLVGLGLLFWAVKATLEWRRFGATPMTMDPFPGSIGGDVGGEILVNIPFQASMAFEVTLSCINSYISGSGKNRSRGERLVWQDKGYAAIHPALRGIRLQFRFEVPDNLPECEQYSDNYHLWRIAVHGDLPGIDLDRSFDIPVYRTAEKSRRISTLSTQHQPSGRAQPGAAELLPLTQTGNQVDIHYPILRKPLASLLLMLFGGIFSGVGALVGFLAAEEGFPLYVMSGIFHSVGGLIVLSGLYTLLNSLHIRFDGRTLTSARRILGVPVRTKAAAYPLIRSFEIKQTGSNQTGKSHSINYQVIAKTASGDIVLAEALDAHSKAERVVDYFRKLTGAGR